LNSEILPLKSFGDKKEPEERFLPSSLREAIYLTVHDSPKPAKAISAALGISYQQLCNACNPHLSFKFSARHLEGLIQASENDLIIEYLARKRGFILFKLPEKKAAAGRLLPMVFKFLDASHKFNKAWQKFFAADRKLIDETLSEIINQSWELFEALLELRALANFLKAEDGQEL
jgi:hypothetical protein